MLFCFALLDCEDHHPGLARTGQERFSDNSNQASKEHQAQGDYESERHLGSNKDKSQDCGYSGQGDCDHLFKRRCSRGDE